MCIENRLAKRRNDFSGVGDHIGRRKRSKLSPEVTGHHPDLFDSLPDDLVLSILCKLTSSATSPADFVNVLITYVPNLLFIFSFKLKKNIFFTQN